MEITKDWLKEKGACVGGTEWFNENYPDGKGDYQQILDTLAKEGKDDWASWLLNEAGRTESVLEVKGDLVIEHGLFFSGFIKVSGRISAKCIKAGLGIEAGNGIEAGKCIKAGWGIEAGNGIKAGNGIEAGKCIKAGWGIEAGDGIEAGWGIEAGDGIKAGWGIKAGNGTGWGIEAGFCIEAGDGIKAGWGIEAGFCIEAGDGIKAGDDFGIYAGLKVRISRKRIDAFVIAKELPKNLLLGFFKEKEKS